MVQGLGAPQIGFHESSRILTSGAASNYPVLFWFESGLAIPRHAGLAPGIVRPPAHLLRIAYRFREQTDPLSWKVNTLILDLAGLNKPVAS